MDKITFEDLIFSHLDNFLRDCVEDFENTYDVKIDYNSIFDVRTECFECILYLYDDCLEVDSVLQSKDHSYTN